MSLLSGHQHIGQLEKRKGGYFFLRVSAEEVATFPRGKKTRLICTLGDEDDFHCGRNHKRNGDFSLFISSTYIINVEKIGGLKWLM